jgi:hypothetical protein
MKNLRFKRKFEWNIHEATYDSMKENMLLHVKPPFTIGIQHKNYTIAEKEIPLSKSIASLPEL